MKIAVFGLGYVGLTAAACLSRQGHEVVGIDVSDEKVAIVNAGKSPITEPGLDQLVERAVRRGLLSATKDATPHLDSCAMALVCVGTPSAPDGSHNMSFVVEVSHQIAELIGSARTTALTIVFRSTMRPGTIEELVLPIFENALRERMDLVELVYNPEFLRESVAIEDFFNPPKIVIGTKDGRRCEALDELNAEIKAPVFYTTYRAAEMTKFVDNTFHAVKVAFANEVGRVCDKLGISATTVHKIFISDTKLNISPYYLRPGGAFGGSCLPKDVRALQYIASDVGAHTCLVDSVLRSNDEHKNFLFENCVKAVPAGGQVLMLGLSFKDNSDDLRESPNIDLARKFLQSHIGLSIYDPHVEPSKLLGQNLGYAFSNLPALRKLLISKSVAESELFDLVIDNRGWAKNMALRARRVIDVDTLS
ncbi:nucleotide sugar dehydrogenase [Bradyrhizobium jicamae]|uniref:UDP-glucose 6-dehydrogenase n=1 Tax=Bradyrhizobium jicamae TaxID=280332 RepID=A0ABS5FGQ6_9BRAD|nr:nucleotide sugar dehydrogenase [Bradyrhizobium jicamae]MBR0795966.1 nucleotide sugar dehydrogenase [Bradyrhizobium jicamae]MBR0935650.1 nucleotide sugar dehydrogenase [Bradyrhizobium jicamae]